MNENHNKIIVCGMGPGHETYWTGKVKEVVSLSDIVIAGSRHLEVLNCQGKISVPIGNNITEVIAFIKENRHKKTGVFVSGDTGFYSMLHVLQNHFLPHELEVFPGISSFQYFYARLGLTYENAKLFSVHGKGFDGLNEFVQTHESVFVLTDFKNSWREVGRYLNNSGLGECQLHIGNNLSYEDEEIVSICCSEIDNCDFQFALCSIVIQMKCTTKSMFH